MLDDVLEDLNWYRKNIALWSAASLGGGREPPRVHGRPRDLF